MKRIFTFTFILLLGSLSLYGQSPTLSDFVGKFTLQGFTAGGTADVVGTLDAFSDQTNQYFANNIQVGDVVWDNLGNRWEVMAVNSSNLLQANVDLRDINDAGGIPFGVGFVSRETSQIGLSLFVPDNNIGISQQLKSRVESHNMLLLEQYITASQDSVYQGATAADTADVDNPTIGDVLITGDGNIVFYDGSQWITFSGGGGGGSPDGNGIYSGSDTIPDNTVAYFDGSTSAGLRMHSTSFLRVLPFLQFKNGSPFVAAPDIQFLGGDDSVIGHLGTYYTSVQPGFVFFESNLESPELFAVGFDQSATLGGRIVFSKQAGGANRAIDLIGPRAIRSTVGSNFFEVGTTSITANSSNAVTITGAGLVGISKTGTSGFLSITAPDDQIILQGEETQLKADTQLIVQVGLNAEMLVKDDQIYFETVPEGDIEMQLGLDADNQLVKVEPGGGGEDISIYTHSDTLPEDITRRVFIPQNSELYLGEDTTGLGISISPDDHRLNIGKIGLDGDLMPVGLSVDENTEEIYLQSVNQAILVDGPDEEVVITSDNTKLATHTGSNNIELIFDGATIDYEINTNALGMQFMGASAVNPIAFFSHAAPTSFIINPNGEVQYNFYDQNKHDEVLSYGHQVLDQNGVAKKVYDAEFNFRDDASGTAQNIHTVVTVNTTMTLPAASGNVGKVFILRANDSTSPATPRTVDVSGGGDIDGDSDPISLSYPGEVRAVVSTGTEYVTLWKNTDTKRYNSAHHTFQSLTSGSNSISPIDGYTVSVASTSNGNTTTVTIDPENLFDGDAIHVIGAATVSGATVNINTIGDDILYKGQTVTTIQLTGPEFLELKLVWTGVEFWAFTSE